jgi:hypothetical protein
MGWLNLVHPKSLLSIAFRLLLAASCLLAAVSCASSPARWDWSYADLRLLDPLDNTPTPSTDILAVYNRTIGSDLEIRIDLLDIPLIPDYDLSLRLTTPAGEITISLPAAGRPVVNPSGTGIQVRLVRDPWLDTVTVRLNRLAVSQPFTLQVAFFVPGESTPADETAPVRSDALPPLNRASLLLAFWDTYPVATPAQALRRWDGAHSGPRGERHGLRHIVDNAAQYRIPVVLLDLKTPASLAALNYMGVLPEIQTLSSQGLLILPDVAYAEPADISLGFSRRAAAGFGLSASRFVYSASSIMRSGYRAQFMPLDDTSHLSRAADTTLIPLPAVVAAQATVDGPSLDLRRQLVIAAFSADPSRLVILGGDLPHSTWGNENMAAPTFAWIAAHPWIRPLTGEDLLVFPLGTHSNLPPGGNVPLPAQSGAPPFLVELRKAPDNPLTASAWQTYLMLTAPGSDEKFRALRAGYFGQLGELLAAARWAQDPSGQAGCAGDLNGDGQPECILSSRNFFAILDPRGGRLSDLFYLDAAGPHQLVGPSSQFTVGLSDPSEWRPGLGESADPAAIPGAFSDGTGIWGIRNPVSTDALTFTSPDDSRTKTYRLTESGLSVTYQGFGSVNTMIPLAVDPQAWYFGPTQYQSASAPGEWTWGLFNGIQVEVRSDAALSAQSFTDSQSFLPGPENPDQGYPAGHYLPFPLSVVTIQSRRDISVQIMVK